MSSQSAPIEIMPGLTLEYLLDGRVACLAAANSSREVIDAFIDTIIQIQPSTPAGQARYFIFDFSHNSAGFNTPYGRSRMVELAKLDQDSMSYSAIILHKTYVTQMAQFFLSKVNRKQSVNRLFFEFDPALAWLKDEVAKRDS
jgi:hypothetical protein